MLLTVLRNLTSNALKFTNPHGTINIYAVALKNSIDFIIEDDGIGMSEKTRNNLFKIEVNNTSAGTANEKGSGLGLLLCKDFIEKLGGNFWIESALNKGCMFKFTIPPQKV